MIHNIPLPNAIRAKLPADIEMSSHRQRLRAEDMAVEALSESDKAIAEKAAKLITRDYSEVIKKLEEE
jgi:hypothetical protein